jgi:hypothetical protein
VFINQHAFFVGINGIKKNSNKELDSNAPNVAPLSYMVRALAMRKIRIAAIILLAASLVLSMVALLLYSGASIPYQDAPPELLVEQANEIQSAFNLLMTGMVGMAIGAAGIWKSRAGRCQKPKG